MRFRPVLMTALAMIIGMLPMALGLEPAANRMRRWDGPSSAGLLFATAATLFFVPVFFSLVHGKSKPLAEASEEQES